MHHAASSVAAEVQAVTEAVLLSSCCLPWQCKHSLNTVCLDNALMPGSRRSTQQQ